ncbi:TetR/AcrR family transcriptional regulator [Microlunatus ginsengisoli]|uniref:TetR/AcrR family transcriptional regulator n=1 Tax=Microlunatus ginsengisoli TaxID=363863 RepID=UPI0031E3AFCD
MKSSAPTSRAYRSDRRTAQARATRRRVIDAAATAFLEQGYAGTTLRLVAGRADVSVPTVEAAFGTKAALLKSAIDVAIAGDDEPVSMIERDWAVDARAAAEPSVVLDLAADVVTAAQTRSAGLVLAAFEGARASPDLRALADQLAGQRAVTARWIVDVLSEVGTLRTGWTPEAATDTLWVLMDPAMYVRLVRDRGWTADAYRDWWRHSASLLLDDSARSIPAPTEPASTEPASTSTPTPGPEGAR